VLKRQAAVALSVALATAALTPAPAHASTVTPASWGLDRIDQRERPLDNSYTYDTGSRGVGVTVYVLDSGITLQPDFGGRASMGPNFRADRFNEEPGSADDCGHGTHVAGTVGSTKYGVARGVTIVAARVATCEWLGNFTEDIIEGINWVIAQHQPGTPAVLNLSLTGNHNNSAALDTAVNNALADGIVVVASAGNSGGDACAESPARVPGVITVGSVKDDDNLAEDSNRGACVDLYAPGVGIRSWGQFRNQMEVMSGTSMAAPHVAGLAARFLQERPDASPATVHNVLVNNASPVSGIKIAHGSHGKQPPQTCEIGDFTTNLVPIPATGIAQSPLQFTGCAWNGAYTTYTGPVRVIWHTDHTRGTDLRIELVGTLFPQQVYLLDAEGGSNARNGTRYLYLPFDGRDGIWHLRVTDKVSGITGNITAWSLTF
jgi:subtilisin family serine protease